jgi:curved DNA-binding protein CbpA
LNDQEFVDFYEVLQLSQSADTETIERVFRLLAKRYHPDNQESGDEEKFRQVHDAYEVLTDPEKRARFDVRNDSEKNTSWQIFRDATALGSHEDDRRIMRGVLNLLFSARRRDPERGGIGTFQMERLLGVPREHLEFPLWVLKKRGWIEIQDNGQPGITIEGVDQVIRDGVEPEADRLLPENGSVREDLEQVA